MRLTRANCCLVICQGQNGRIKYGYARTSTDDQTTALQFAR
jgi:hypothetical protein